MGCLPGGTGARQIAQQEVRFVVQWQRDDRGTVLLKNTNLLVLGEG